MIRVGHGYDVHRLVDRRELVLGGIKVEHTQGLDGHSDADVLIHAVCDAVLGALGKGDIGQHFPDTDAKFADIDSRILLRSVVDLMHEADFQLGNLDVTVIAQAPKLANYLPSMQANLAADFKADLAQVNVKATTTESLGFAGREEGISAHAVVLLSSNS